MLFSAKAFTQRPNTGMWLNAQVPVSFTKKWQWHNDVSYRTLGNSVAPLQYEYRTGLRYNINTIWSVAAGSAFFRTRNGFLKQHDEFGKEFRLWQELTYRKNITKPFQLYIRLRTEQRNFAATSTKAAYYANRYRIKLQPQYQFNKHWALQVADEYMQQSVNSSLNFDQNRLFVNAVYLLPHQTSVSTGYMWVKRPENISQHILNITFQKTILLHGKQ